MGGRRVWAEVIVSGGGEAPDTPALRAMANGRRVWSWRPARHLPGGLVARDVPIPVAATFHTRVVIADAGASSVALPTTSRSLRRRVPLIKQDLAILVRRQLRPVRRQVPPVRRRRRPPSPSLDCRLTDRRASRQQGQRQFKATGAAAEQTSLTWCGHAGGEGNTLPTSTAESRRSSRRYPAVQAAATAVAQSPPILALSVRSRGTLLSPSWRGVRNPEVVVGILLEGGADGGGLVV